MKIKFTKPNGPQWLMQAIISVRDVDPWQVLVRHLIDENMTEQQLRGWLAHQKMDRVPEADEQKLLYLFKTQIDRDLGG